MRLLAYRILDSKRPPTPFGGLGFACRCSKVTEGRGVAGGHTAPTLGQNQISLTAVLVPCSFLPLIVMWKEAELKKLDASLEERRSIQKVLQIAQKACKKSQWFYAKPIVL